MIKSIIGTLVFLFFTMSLFAQSRVGISNPNPDEKLHVDSGSIKVGKLPWQAGDNGHYIKFGDGDNVKIGEDSSDDRMVLSAYDFIFMPSQSGYTGNVGIGTNMPNAKLDIVGNIKIADGSQGAGKVLTSDGLGNASWQTPNNYPSLAMKICLASSGVLPTIGSGTPAAGPYVGEIRIFPYPIVPTGWLECKGQLVPIANYPDLFTILGTQFGGDGITTFGLPDYTGKVIVGQ